MSVFITLVTDPFETMIQNQFISNGNPNYLISARRPMRGIEIKQDTYAYLRLIRADGVEIPLINSSASGGEIPYSNFLLQSVEDAQMERHQVIETFGETYLYLFGHSPRMLSVQAVLLDTHDFNWKAEFEYNYENYLRGTKALEYGARTYLFYNDNVVEGYILNASTSHNANSREVIPLAFQFFVTNIRNLTNVTDKQFPTYGFEEDYSYEVNPDDKEWVASAKRVFSQAAGNTPVDNESSNVKSLKLRSNITSNKDEYTAPVFQDAWRNTQPKPLPKGNTKDSPDALYSDVANAVADKVAAAKPKDSEKTWVDKVQEAVNGAQQAIQDAQQRINSAAQDAQKRLNEATNYLNSGQAGRDLSSALGLSPTMLPAGVSVRTGAIVGSTATFGASGYSVAQVAYGQAPSFGVSASIGWPIGSYYYSSYAAQAYPAGGNSVVQNAWVAARAGGYTNPAGYVSLATKPCANGAASIPVGGLPSAFAITVINGQFRSDI